jgi:16S rRNA (guanine966-N2)-methyltransferase
LDADAELTATGAPFCSRSAGVVPQLASFARRHVRVEREKTTRSSVGTIRAVSLRVIAGSAGGRRLVAPTGDARPTTDRLKEALFSSLGPRVHDATVLDLYAGSGALAIEALSRGAGSAVLVDFDSAATAAIRANLATTGFEAAARVERIAVERFVTSRIVDAPFDLVFLDPPYDLASAEVAAVLNALAVAEAVTDGATVVVERPKSGEPVALPAGWGSEKERVYGDTLLVVAHAG